MNPPQSFYPPKEKGIGPPLNPDNSQDEQHRLYTLTCFRQAVDVEAVDGIPQIVVERMLTSEPYLFAMHRYHEHCLTRALKYIKRGIYVYPIDRFVILIDV